MASGDRNVSTGLGSAVSNHLASDKVAPRECPGPPPLGATSSSFLFAKDRYYYFDKSKLPCDSGAEDVWSIPARPRQNVVKQTAPFPDELVEQCLAVGCPPGGVVLDPFCGSGTTMRIALRDGYSALGIELNEEFCEYILSDLRSLP